MLYPAPTLHRIETASSIRVSHSTINGHHVRVVSWRPGDYRVRVGVTYSKAGQAPVVTGRHTSSTIAVMNGCLWTWATGRPSGTLVSHGRLIRSMAQVPAVGFTPGGGVVWGSRASLAAHLRNVECSEGYVVQGGRVAPRSPWVDNTEYTCGPRGTDGNGCFRSNVVEFKNGRVGFVEVAFASTVQAARILVRLGAETAATFDSGGSATMWTSAGHGGCPKAGRGRCFGVTSAIGMKWQRPVVSSMVLQWRRS